MRTPELLLLGGPNSGKTHFAGQLYGRLQRRPGALRLRKEHGGTPADLRALEEVLRCLEDGHTALHTSAGTWAEVSLPLVDVQGNRLDLRWPDYAGEQLQAVFERREVSETWHSQLTRADAWVVLIRLNAETTYGDALKTLTQHRGHRTDEKKRATEWDANARWVELFQLLLHVAGRSNVTRLAQPRLMVLLSCYDELPTTEKTPRQVLTDVLPMFSSYLDSSWESRAMSVWGLSALGKPLTLNSADQDFIDNGPESQGWVVDPTGTRIDADLTLPLAWLLR